MKRREVSSENGNNDRVGLEKEPSYEETRAELRTELTRSTRFGFLCALKKRRER